MRAITLWLALAGAVIILFSQSVAHSVASTERREPGGFRTFHVDMEKKAAVSTSLRLIGGIMLGVGLFRGLEPRKEA